MKTSTKILLALAITLGVYLSLLATVGIVVRHINNTPVEPKVSGIELGLCTITESIVTVGHQLSKEVLAESSSRQWAVIQQPVNATNTTSFSFGSTAAVSGKGLHLYPSVSASTTDSIKLGFSTDLRTGSAVNAITSTGSTTLKVIDCK